MVRHATAITNVAGSAFNNTANKEGRDLEGSLGAAKPSTATALRFANNLAVGCTKFILEQLVESVGRGILRLEDAGTRMLLSIFRGDVHNAYSTGPRGTKIYGLLTAKTGRVADEIFSRRCS